MVYRPELSDTLPVWDMQLIDNREKNHQAQGTVCKRTK